MKEYEAILATYEKEGRHRSIPVHVDASQGFIDLTSNDYMGLARKVSDSEIREWMEETLSIEGSLSFTSSASRLLASNQMAYGRLENLLSTLYGKSVLLLNSGYHANVGVVQALAAADIMVFSDKLVHASIIDGIRLSGVKYKRFPHNDAQKLRKLVQSFRESDTDTPVWIVTESVFSMDGDIAPLEEILAIKRDFPKVFLYLDEAHAIGVRGAKGLGMAEETGLLEEVDILVGTFGKGVASVGAFAACTPVMREYLLNATRSFIFSTALPPVNAAWTAKMLETLTTMEKERRELREMSSWFASELRSLMAEAGMDAGSLSAAHSTPIVPFMTGDAKRAVEIAAHLRGQGILALPIRRPTVAAGTERIRFSLYHGLTKEELERVLRQIRNILHLT